VAFARSDMSEGVAVSNCLMMTSKFVGVACMAVTSHESNVPRLGIGVASGLSRYKSGEGGDGIRGWICQPVETLAELECIVP